jgi:hypothetical protein
MAMSIFDDPDRLQAAERQVLGVESKQAYEEYQERIEKLHALVDDMEDDWDRANWELEIVADKQFRRRTLIRTLFAVIEGIVFALKHLILEEHRAGIVDVSYAEYAVLAEKTYRLDSRGHLKGSNSYPSLEGNVKFTFAIYARIRGASSGFTIPLGKDARWESLRTAIDIRNRLMHPKSTEDLIVSDSEWEAVQAAEDWFFEQHEHLRTLDDQVFGELLSQLAELLSESEEEASDHTAPKI